MSLIEWKVFYNTNFTEIDEQHKKLVNLINKTITAKIENKVEAVKEILTELIEYTHVHFQFEENLLADYKYDKLIEHKHQHQILIKQIIKILENIKNGDSQILDDIKSVLENWLIKHICDHDREFAKAFNKI